MHILAGLIASVFMPLSLFLSEAVPRPTNLYKCGRKGGWKEGKKGESEEEAGWKERTMEVRN